MGKTTKGVPPCQEQVLNEIVQAPGEMGETIFHGHILRRNDQHTEE